MKLRLLSKMLLSILTPAIAGLLLVAGASYKMSEDMLREQIRNDAVALLRCQSIGLHAMLKVMEESLSMITVDTRVLNYLDAVNNKNLSINNFPISLPESDEGSSQMRESQVS